MKAFFLYFWRAMIIITIVLAVAVILISILRDVVTPEVTKQQQIDACRAIGGQPVVYPTMWLKECVLPK